MKIENYRQGAMGSNILAEFDIYFGEQWGMTFKNWKLIRTRKGGYMLSGPNYSIADDQGIKKWYPYIEFSPEKKHNFEKKILEMLKDFGDLK